jgi:hypothetical protein
MNKDTKSVYKYEIRTRRLTNLVYTDLYTQNLQITHYTFSKARKAFIKTDHMQRQKNMLHTNLMRKKSYRSYSLITVFLRKKEIAKVQLRWGGDKGL